MSVNNFHQTSARKKGGGDGDRLAQIGYRGRYKQRPLLVMYTDFVSYKDGDDTRFYSALRVVSLPYRVNPSMYPNPADDPNLYEKTPSNELVLAEDSTTPRSLAERFGEVANVKDFGAVGDGVADDTSSIAAAVASQKKVVFPKGTYRITATTTVSVDVCVDLGEAIIVYDGVDVMFDLDGADIAQVTGGYVAASTYTSDRPQLMETNFDNPTDPTRFPSRIIIEGVRTFNVGLYYGRVNTLTDTTAYVKIKNNHVMTDDNADVYAANLGKTSLRPWLWLSGFDNVDVDAGVTRKGTVDISNNTLDTYMNAGFNKDLMKVSGNIKHGDIVSNTLINRNAASNAELDVFTGGFLMNIMGNNFQDVSVKVQTHEGSLAPNVGEAYYTNVENNRFTLASDSYQQWAILFSTSFGNVAGNIVRFTGPARTVELGEFRALRFRELDGNNDGYGSNRPSTITVSSNMVYIDIPSTAVQPVIGIDIKSASGCSFTGNVVSGGWDMLQAGDADNARNVWTGNNIYSANFTAEGVWRMRTSMIGSGNRIAQTQDPAQDAGAYMLSKNFATFINGDTIEITLDDTFRQANASGWSTYILYIRVTGGSRTNWQSFIISSAPVDGDDQATWITPISSRIDFETGSATLQRSVFKAGFDASGNIRLRALTTSAGNAASDPDVLYYAIEPITAGTHTVNL